MGPARLRPLARNSPDGFVEQEFATASAADFAGAGEGRRGEFERQPDRRQPLKASIARKSSPNFASSAIAALGFELAFGSVPCRHRSDRSARGG